jgi:hypothetical protein
MAECARRIVLELTSDYLRDPARAAPLLLPLPERPTTLQELVAAAFNQQRVPFSRFDFPGLVAERAFLPVFTLDSPDSSWRAGPEESPAREVLARGGKVVLVTSEEAAVAPHQVALRWSVPGRHVRSFGAGAREPSVVPPPLTAVTDKGIGDPSRFQQGRALVVGVASYARGEASRIRLERRTRPRKLAAVARARRVPGDERGALTGPRCYRGAVPPRFAALGGRGPPRRHGRRVLFRSRSPPRRWWSGGSLPASRLAAAENGYVPLWKKPSAGVKAGGS